MDQEPRIFAQSFASVYPHYVAKALRKGRTQSEVNEIICWLTGYDDVMLQQQIADAVTIKSFFYEMPQLNEGVSLIKGMICGYRVEMIEDPLMQQIRYLDKLIDELAKGKAMAKILREV